MRSLGLLGFLFLSNCRPAAPQTSKPLPVHIAILEDDPGCDVEIEAACTNLVYLGCSAGCDGGPCVNAHGDTCPVVLWRALALTDLDLTCVIRASRPERVSDCGPFWKDACK